MKNIQTPKNKNENNRLWKAGLLGNRIRMWNTVEEVMAEQSTVIDVTVRSLIPGDKKCFYRVPLEQLHKYDNGQFYFNESCPDEYLTMQGEIIRIWSGWCLYYSLAKFPMRIALQKEGRYADGASVLPILKHFANGNGYDMLMELFDKYDTDIHKECAIEFSCYSHCLGIFPHNNTIVWEVRAY